MRIRPSVIVSTLALPLAAACLAALPALAGAAVIDGGLTLTPVGHFDLGKPSAASGVSTKALPAGGFGYANIDNFQGAGAGTVNATLVGTNTITTLVADDINTNAPGGTVTEFTFSVVNFSDATVNARPVVRLYAADGAGGGPGTLFGVFTFGSIPIGPGVGALTTGPLGAGNFALPADGSFFAGIAYDNDSGATGATAADLNNLGTGLFDPPTTGTSQDALFNIDPPQGDYTTSNPTFGIFNFGAGGPIANAGWQFQVTPVPEPAGLSLLGLGGLALLRRRRA